MNLGFSSYKTRTLGLMISNSFPPQTLILLTKIYDMFTLHMEIMMSDALQINLKKFYQKWKLDCLSEGGMGSGC